MQTDNSAQVLSIWLGRLALAGVLYFFLVSTAVQFLRPEYSVMGTPLSFYLLGPYGGWLHGAFYALAAAILMLAIGCYIDSERPARTAATLVLFTLGAAGVAMTAVFPTDTTATLTRHGMIHVIAAAVAFLATSVAMLMQSWRFRHDPHWRRRFRNATATVFDKFRLRLCGSIGRRSRCSSSNRSSNPAGSPRLSGPNKNASPAW